MKGRVQGRQGAVSPAKTASALPLASVWVFFRFLRGQKR